MTSSSMSLPACQSSNILGNPPAFRSVLRKMVSASALSNLAGHGRPRTRGAVSKISFMHPDKCRLSSGSRDMRALGVPPDKTEDGFMDELI